MGNIMEYQGIWKSMVCRNPAKRSASRELFAPWPMNFFKYNYAKIQIIVHVYKHVYNYM